MIEKLKWLWVRLFGRVFIGVDYVAPGTTDVSCTVEGRYIDGLFWISNVTFDPPLDTEADDV